MAETQITPEESNLILAAMLKAQQEGDEEAADNLGKMAADPEKLKALLDQAAESAGATETLQEAPQKSGPKNPTIKALPRKTLRLN